MIYWSKFGVLLLVDYWLLFVEHLPKSLILLSVMTTPSLLPVLATKLFECGVFVQQRL